MRDGLLTPVRDLIAELLELDPGELDLDANLIQAYGADSLMVLELMGEVEKRFGVVLERTQFPELMTVNRAVALIERMQGEREDRA